jgi:hypothetical protein
LNVLFHFNLSTTDKMDEREIDGIMPVESPTAPTKTESEVSEQYFVAEDENYINKLKTLLKKLRRYRWLYFHSSDYYERIDDNFIYYPTIIFSMIISALALVTASSDVSEENYLSYTVAVLGIIIAGLREIQTKKQFSTKKIKFESAGVECHILVAKVNHEIEFPDENPYKFVSDIENQMIKIITDLYFKPPNHLVLRYNTTESDDTSSDNIEITPTHTKKKDHKTRYNKNFYDYDLEDSLEAEKTSVRKRKNKLKREIIASTRPQMDSVEHLVTKMPQTSKYKHNHSTPIGAKCVGGPTSTPVNSFINLRSNNESYYRSIKGQETKKHVKMTKYIPETIKMEVIKSDKPSIDIESVDTGYLDDDKSQISIESNLSQ